MSEGRQELQKVLAEHEEILWQLHMDCLQLSVADDTQGRGSRAPKLFEEIAGLIIGLGGPGLDGILTSVVTHFNGGQGGQAGMGLAIRLVEALASLVQGDEGKALDGLIERESGTLAAGDSSAVSIPDAVAAPGTPVPVSAEAAEGPLMDSHEGVDPEELREFCVESLEHLQTVESGLIEMEQAGDCGPIAEIFRGIHSIKGGSQYIGLGATAALTHRMESLLARVRSNEIAPSASIIALLLSGVDAVAALLEGAKKMQVPSIDVAGLVKRLEAVIETSGAEAGPPASAAETVAPEVPIAEPASQDPTTQAVGGLEAPFDEPAGEAPSHETDQELFAKEFRLNRNSARTILADGEGLGSDPKRVATLTRNLHSLKGISGIAGVEALEILASGVESLLTRVFRGAGEIDAATARVVGESLDLLDSLFEEYLSTGRTTLAIDAQVQQLQHLAQDREVNSTQAQGGEAPEAASSEHPVERLFGELEQAAHAGDRRQVTDILELIEEAASLHGLDDMEADACSIRASLATLSSAELLARVGKLGRELRAELGGDAGPESSVTPEDETFEDILQRVPGIGEKKIRLLLDKGLDCPEVIREAGVAGLLKIRGINVDQAVMLVESCTPKGRPPEPDATSLASFASLVRTDQHDRDLVAIYLDTTKARVASLQSRLAAGETSLAWQTLADLACAAGYMGYAPLAGAFRAAAGALQGESPDVAGARAAVERLSVAVTEAWTAVHGDTTAGDQEESRATERTELETIFTDSAETHLGKIATELIAFLEQMSEEHLTALQHHMGCLHLAATNMGKEGIAKGSESLRLRVEEAWLEPERLDQAGADAFVSDLLSLFASCQVAAPDLVAPSVPDHSAATEPSITEPIETDAGPPLEEEAWSGDESGGWSESGAEPFAEEGGELPAAEAAVAADELTNPTGMAPADASAPLEPIAAPRAGDDVLGLQGGEEDSSPPAGEDPSLGDETSNLPSASGGGPGGTPPDSSDGGSGGPFDGSGPEDHQRGLVETQTTVRVDTDKIDGLMNMVAELVVNRSSFMVLGSSLRGVLDRLIETGDISKLEARNLRSVINRYEEATTDLGRVSNQLQEGVMRIRMMPVKTLFSRAPRLVRDLARREGRDVQVSFSGEETELDKTVIERLSDPLVHLIRNAISHGIEAPDERRAAGKPAQASIHVTAHHEGNMVTLEVEDDGRGIDPERIRARLVDRGLVEAGEAERMSRRELLSSLFLPGFSTADSVNDVSGRGVGLDVVKRNIEELGGQVDVVSEPGRSCRFSLRIPLTMAIMQALLVRADGDTYSIPVASVIQTVKVERSDIASVEGQEVVTIRGAVTPLLHLGDIFAYNYYAETWTGGEQGAEALTSKVDSTVHVVVIQGEDGRQFGMAVDELLGSQDIVIKSLEDELVDSRGVAGAAILGDGGVTLIIDIAELQRISIDKEHYADKRQADQMRQLDRFLDRSTIGPVLTTSTT